MMLATLWNAQQKAGGRESIQEFWSVDVLLVFWNCYPVPDLVQLNFGTLYWTKHPKSSLSYNNSFYAELCKLNCKLCKFHILNIFQLQFPLPLVKG